jgi:hypothetical protein
VRRLLLATLLLSAVGCHRQPPPSAKQAVGWHMLRSWSGQGNAQTESFTSDSGQLRIRWRTTHEGVSNGLAGRFRLTAHSAISGRPMQMAVDEQGRGEGTAYVGDDPHEFYFVVESANLDWSFTVEEAVAGTVEDAAPRRP